MKQFFATRKREKSLKKERDSKRVVLEEVFNDMYDERGRIYKLNFVRGLLFGAGSALGGTVVIALIVWVLSLFVNAPLIGDLFKNAQQTIDQSSLEDRN